MGEVDKGVNICPNKDLLRVGEFLSRNTAYHVLQWGSTRPSEDLYQQWRPEQDSD